MQLIRLREMDKTAAVIKALQLEPHIEGGYFKRTYTSRHITTGNKVSMSSIYYMLTTDGPIGHTSKNCSDIMRYYHLGLPFRYLVLFPDGNLEETILGPDILAGHKLQLIVPGGTWVSTEILTREGAVEEFGIVSEAVTPGFEYSDMVLATKEVIQSQYPQHWNTLRKFIRPNN